MKFLRTHIEYLLLLIASASLILYAIFLFNSNGYYTYLDIWGPLSKDWRTNLSLMFLVASLLTIALITIRHAQDNTLPRKTFLTINLFLISTLIISKYLLPDLADTYYSTNFGDTLGHMKRGAFVTLTGHSDPTIDGYFDMQPGFFWVTAILINVIWGVPSSPSAPIFGFFEKWFHLIAISIYAPIIFFLLKKYGLKTNHALLALFLFYGIHIGRFHYAANVWGNFLFWIILAMLPMIFKNPDRRLILLISIIFLSIIFVHQGVAFFTFGTLLSILVLTRLIRTLKFRTKIMAQLTLLFSLFWILYLLYSTKYYFIRSLFGVIAIVRLYLSTGLVLMVEAGSYRPYQPWQQMIYVKMIYLSLTLLLPTLILLYKSIKEERYQYRIALFSIIGASFLAGIVSIGIGGAGYIERILLELSPLLVFALAMGILKEKSIKYFAGSILLVALIVLATPLYFSGRNFQSIPYSEVSEVQLNIKHDPNSIASLYSTRHGTLRYLFYTNSTIPSSSLFEIVDRDKIRVLYYYSGDPEYVEERTEEFVNINNIIYSSDLSKLIITK